ncbi:hypothetical protein KIPB_014010, partial [Kipferlia bialata]
VGTAEKWFICTSHVAKFFLEFKPARLRADKLHEWIEQTPKAEWAALKRCIDDPVERPRLIATVQAARRQRMGRYLQWEKERNHCEFVENAREAGIPHAEASSSVLKSYF